MRELIYLKLKPNESVDQPAGELKPRIGVVIHAKDGGYCVFENKVRGGRYDVNGAPRGMKWLLVEGEVVYVVPKVAHTC